MIQALLTGSRVYGRPTKKSDLDVVMLLTDFEMLTMEKMADEVTNTSYDAGDARARSLRFGRLNVIAVTSPVAFGAFIEGTALLKKSAKKRGPVDRKEAVRRMAGLRQRYNLGGGHINPAPTTSKPEDDIPF